VSTVLLDQATLDRIVSQTIPQATDATHQNAIVGTVDTTGIQVVAHFELHQGSGWELDDEAVAAHNWNGDNEVGDKVILKW